MAKPPQDYQFRGIVAIYYPLLNMLINSKIT